MKRFLALVALVLGMVSCQTEPEGFDVIVGGEVDTVVTVTIPEAETRANTSSLGVFNNGILDDPNVTMRYILEIYYGDESRDRLVDYSDGTEVAFPVRLVPDRHYNFVVWADVVTKEATATEFTDDDNHYNTTNLKAITLNGEWDAMDETRDAFTGYFNTATDGDRTTYNGSKAINIPLTRPFAKLRVITTDFDELAKYGIVAKSGQVSYSSEYRGRASFNAYNGEPSDAVTSFLGGSYDIVAYASENGGDEHTIFSDYIFASTNGDIVKFDLNIYEDEEGNNLIKANNFNTDIRVQRNYITTIKGDVLTTSGNVTVTVNPGFEEDEIIKTYVDSADDLQDIINGAQSGEETNIVIGGNIDLGDLLNAGLFSTRAAEPTYGLLIPAGKEVVLNLNGFTISQSKACDASYSMIVNNGQLTITGEGAIEFTNTAVGGGSTWGTYTIENRGEAVLTIDNATIRHNGCVNGETDYDTNIAIQNYEGKVVINDGTIASPEFRSLRDFTAGGEIIINGGTFLGQVWMQGLGNGSSSLTINGGSFSPVEGYDGSSVYINNNTNVVNVAITGGMFNTKVGCFDPNKEGANGCITGGTFTTAAKEATNEALLDSLYEFVDNDDDTWTVDSKGYYTDENGNYCIISAKGLVALSSMTIAGGKSVKLGADIDLKGVEFNGLNAFNPENNNTFDGQGHTVSNWTYTGKADDMGFIRNWVGPIKNLTIKNAILRTGGRSAVIAAKPYGNIENCHVVDCNLQGNWWACGLIVGMHNSGNIKDCSATNSYIKSTGGTAAITGVLNETDGTRTFTNCTVTGCTIYCTNENAAEPWYAGGAIVGMVNLDYSNIEFNNCQTENNTFKGEFSNDSYYGYSFSPVKINGVSVINTADELAAAIKAGGNYILGADIAMTEATYQNVDVTIDGNGHTISQVEGSTNTYGLFDSITGKLTLKNIVFDGIKGGAVLRTVGAELTLDNITVKNCEHTQQQGLFRLMGKNTIKNCIFEDNTCNMVISLNYDGANNDPQLVENCVFDGNTCNKTAVLYYVKGAGATINGNKFVNNIVNVSNGATLYMGFTENNVITNNLFEGNIVTATSVRSSGGLMIGYTAVVTGNAFVNNTVTVNGKTGYGNDVCASPYYAPIDLSGNYWGGGAPVENVNYYKEYNNYELTINGYLTENPIK